MSSPPAWGFGSSNRSSGNRNDRDFAAISPVSYNRTLVDKTKLPQYSMGAKLKALEPSFIKVPGAGTYSPPSKIGETAGKTFSKKLYNSHF